MMQEYLIKKGIDLAFKVLDEKLKSTEFDLQITSNELESSISHHLKEVSTWASEISFSDLRTAKETDAVFIPLNIYVQPRRSRIAIDEKIESVSLEELFIRNHPQHSIILGQPGAGKTTSLKHLCKRMMLDESLSSDFGIPILIRLRELNVRYSSEPGGDVRASEISLFNRIQEILGLRIRFPKDLEKPEHAGQRRQIRERALLELLNSLKAVVFLDGFDEIVFKTARDTVIGELRTLTEGLDHAAILMTARTGEFSYHFEKASHYEISPLSQGQIQNFCVRWLGEKRGPDLVSAIKQSPFNDTAMRPLTIAHLCAIYERNGRIPEKPKTVYRKVINLLIEEWDEQRSVVRQSAFSRFEADRKFEFLAHLSYVLTTSRRGTVFGEREFRAAYEKIHENFQLPSREARKVANELEEQTGLFIETGYELYEFSHKSLQEFLSAEFIVKLPTIPSAPQVIKEIPNELAVAIAISSRPSEYLAELVFGRLSNLKLDFRWLRAFINRLLLEKPDFDRSSRVGTALLQLYSRYLEQVMGTDKQLHLFVIDNLVREFEELASAIKYRVNAKKLLEFFEVVEKLDGLDGEPVLRLERIQSSQRRVQGHLTPTPQTETTTAELKSQLWIRETLLASNNT